MITAAAAVVMSPAVAVAAVAVAVPATAGVMVGFWSLAMWRLGLLMEEIGSIQ
jgi:hypothetical protein